MAQGPAAFLPRLRASGYQQALIVLTVGIALSLGLSLWVATQVDRQVQDRFERLGQRQIERIQSRIELYTYGLKGVRGIFAEQPGLITEAHFRAYSQSRDLPREFPGATAWGFAERLPASVGNIQALLARQGVERYFRFDGQAAPAAGQDAWVVRLIEPPAARAGLLGIDLASEPARQATALDAMQRGQPALSPLLAPDAQSAAPHFLFLLPVYGSSIAHPGNVAGWVFARLDAEAVFAFLGAEAGLAEHLELDILDTTQKGEPQPLFSLRQGQGSLTTNRHRLRTAMPLSRQHTLDVGGRRWAVHITGRPALYSGAERWLPPLALAIGTLITLIVAGLIGLNSSRRGEAEDRARRTAVSLREREAQLQSTLTSLDDWVFVLDAEGRVLDCHEPSHHPAWLARNDFMNQPLATVLPPAAQAEFEHALREIRTHLYTTFEFSLHNQNHSRHFVARLSARRLEDGQLDGTTLVARDVTRERAQDRDVRASEEKFRSVFAEAPQAIVLSLQNRHVDANAAALRLFGIPNLSAMQHSAMGMLSPLTQPDGTDSTEALAARMRLTIEEGPQHFDWTFRRLSSGELFPAEVHACCIEIGGEPHFLSVITDLSSHKRAEQELIRARDAAEAATREKSEFLATMSHEIRTPMNGVLGMAQLLAHSELNAEQLDYLNTIQQSGHSLLAIINDILDFSKIEVGKLSFEEVPFDLQVAVDETCELLLPQIRDKNLALTIEIDPSTPFNVIGDPGRFRQILLNYLSNALKFTQVGGITVTLRARERGRGAVLYEMSVADTGIGIDPEKQALLFEKFSQVDTTHARRFGGTGLGLAICKALVERMGGKVSMASSPGRGSTFRATFWLTLDPDAGRQVLPPLLPPLRGAPVLVVDDSATNRELLIKGLARAGVAVYGAGSVAEAVLAVQRQAPRFVLLDAELPDGNAETLITALRAEPALGDARLLLLSSRPDSNDHAFCREHGISAYLPKPARLAWLVSAFNIITAGEHEGLITRHTLSSHHLRGKALPALRPGIRVLLVEDNAVNQKVAARMLEKMGCHVDMAGNGLEALVMTSQLPYNVILMDVQMPEMDGITATRALRSQGFSELPIIALTANSSDADRNECRAAGMSDFLAKPIRYEDLHACLNRWV